jgi:hypothetical protein
MNGTSGIGIGTGTATSRYYRYRYRVKNLVSDEPYLRISANSLWIRVRFDFRCINVIKTFALSICGFGERIWVVTQLVYTLCITPWAESVWLLSSVMPLRFVIVFQENVEVHFAFQHSLIVVFFFHFTEVRNAAVDSLCELASHSSSFAQLCQDFLVDMFNDEIEIVRLNAINSLRKICVHFMLREDQLEIILSVLKVSKCVS